MAQLLAEAWRDRRSGTLELQRHSEIRRIRVRDGAPVALDGESVADGLARQLEESGHLGHEDRRRIEALARQRECSEATAVLALDCVDASTLYTALRHLTRERLCETFGWRDGAARWLPDDDGGDPAAARPFDLPALLAARLPREWGSERLFEALMPETERFAEVVPRLRRMARQLAGTNEAAQRVLARLDGSIPIGRVLGECAGDPAAAALLWTLRHTGMLRLHDRAIVRDAARDLEIEVVVDDRSAGREGSDRPGSAGGPRVRGEAQQAQADEVRQEIETLLAQLDELDHYCALGLEPDASAAAIKKAYFKAAKRFHPDALARLGLAELRDDAARVFGRISQAFDVLSDPERKARYDAGGDDATQIDTARLAQAEQAFRKGEVLLRMGNFQAAVEFLARAVELWPDEPAYRSALGWALYKQPRSQPEQAREHLEAAQQGAPDDALVLYRLGLVLRAVGENDAGQALVARAQALDPKLGG